MRRLCFLLRRRLVPVRHDRVVALMIMPAIGLLSVLSILFRPPLLTFGGRSLNLPVTTRYLFANSSLTLCGSPAVQLSRSTIGAEVFVWNGLAMVVALDVLPCITLLAQDGISIIVCICAYTFDGVVFFILTIGVGQRTVNERRG